MLVPSQPQYSSPQMIETRYKILDKIYGFDFPDNFDVPMFSFIPGYNNILFNLTKIPDRSPPIEGENYLSDDFIEILKQKCVVDSLDSDYLNLKIKLKKQMNFLIEEI